LKTGCVILAGGKGRRLGREKAWVELGGKSLLQHAVSNLEFLNSEIVIVKAPECELPPVSAGFNSRWFRILSVARGHWPVYSRGW
jgi:molybdopterin-guanine dinucleotide biosynthesis protein A